MATIDEIEQALRKDQTFLRLHQEDPELATKYAEQAFQLAEKPQATQKAGDGPVRAYVRPVLEGVGAIGGGALGLPLGPTGAAAGGVLGGAGGSALADVAEQIAGEQRPPQTLREAGHNTIENLKTGAIAEIGGQTLNFFVKGGQYLLKPFAHLIDPAKKRVMDLAEQIGVPLSPGDITHSKPLSMFVEGIAERTPFSAGQIQTFRMEGMKKLVERRNELLEKGGTPQAIEETGQRIQQQMKEFIDRLGVQNQNMRQTLADSTLARLGSEESFEALGQTAQASMKQRLTDRSERVSRLYNEALGLAPVGSRIQPTNLQQTVARLEQESQNTDPELLGNLTPWFRQFRGSGNRAYDEQQRWLTTQLQGVPDNLRARATDVLMEGKTFERSGYDPQELSLIRARLNAAIDDVDTGLKLTGQVGVRGVGKSTESLDKGPLLALKEALDADVQAFSTAHGGEIEGALEVAKVAAGNLKTLSNAKAMKAFLQARPQEAARMLAQSKDLQGIRIIRNTMGPEFHGVEQAFANEILGVGREGTLSPAFLRGQLNQYRKGVAEVMLGPGGVRQIRQLANQLESLDAVAVENPFFQRVLKANPDKVVDYIVKPHNTVNIREVRDRLGDGAVQDLARGMANKLLRKPDYNMPENEFLISPAKLLSGLKHYGDDTLKELYRHDPKFLQEMQELTEVANASQGAARMAANPSGTGQSLIAFGELTMMLYNPAVGSQIILGIPAVTKLYLSPMGRKWLTTGFQTNPTSPEAAKIVGKLMGIAAADATRTELPPLPASGPPYTLPERDANARPGPIALMR